MLGHAAGQRLQRVMDNARSARRGLAHVLGDMRRAQGELGQPRVGKTHRLQRAGSRPRRAAAPFRASRSSAATISAKRSRNHGSNPEIALIRSTVKPWRSASAATSSRSGVGGASATSISCGDRKFELADPVEPAQPGLERSQRLLQALREAPPDRHHLADRLHRRRQIVRRSLELLEGEARDLGHDIVDCRLEARRGRAAGDVVGDLVERVADRQFGRDLGDREAGRLRCQRRGARNARVHLDHDHPPGLRIDCELDVGTACFDTDFAQHRDRCRAHPLIFLVGQGQRRRDGDRIAGMDPHRVDILDRADDDGVVGAVAHHLHLIFLPAEHRFLDQHLVAGRRFEPAADDRLELLAVVGDAPARPAQA